MSKAKRKDKKGSGENLDMSKVSELESAVSELTKNVTNMQRMMEAAFLAVKSTEDKNENLQSNHGKNNTADLSESRYPGSRSYISLWKDIGGSSIVFVPGGSTHPVDFMKKLSNALEDAGVPGIKRVSFAVNGLRGSAATWAAAKQNRFETFNGFYNAFMERYWNSEDERKTFRKIQYGSYEGGSRGDYFLKLVNENNYLSEPLTERELVNQLVKHFDHCVRRGVANNGLYEVDEV